MENSSILLMLLAGASLVSVVVLAILYVKKRQAYAEIHERLIGIVDIEAERMRVQKEYTAFLNEANTNTEALRKDYAAKRDIYDQLLHEVTLLEENLEDISFGLYKPHYEYDTPEEYKARLDEIRQEQKYMLKEKTVALCEREWEVSGSKKEGKKMTDRSSKLMLRAFNGECDAAVAKVKWNNVDRMTERVTKSHQAINKVGESLMISISGAYLDLKLSEIYLTHEHQEKLNEVKEEQRVIKEQMREEEKVRREIEKARRDAEKEEKDYQQALERARKELESATGEEMSKLSQKIAKLEEELADAERLKERAISRAQLTKSGHVYVISNVGSFGDRVFKIGLTRRLEPMVRVKELGDASVPFAFDVHAMIYADDAPELETELHKHFTSRRVNLINERKEFFHATIDEIERAVAALHGHFEFTKLAEAEEYRKTVAMRRAKEQRQKEVKKEQFPVTL